MKIQGALRCYRFKCFIHGIQRIIACHLFDQRLVNDVISKSKNICTHFNHPVTATNAFHKVQQNAKPGKDPLSVKQDVTTRWNSKKC